MPMNKGDHLKIGTINRIFVSYMYDTKVKMLTSTWATSSEFNVILREQRNNPNRMKFLKDKLQQFV